MQIYYRHTQEIIDDYNGTFPLHLSIGKFYKAHPRLGSRDRKVISEMVYSWYRVVKAMDARLPFQEKIQAALLLCSVSLPAAQKLLPEAWLLSLNSALEEKVVFLRTQSIYINLDNLLPEEIRFSEGIDAEEWVKFFLVQPRLFLRIRSKKQLVLEALDKNDVPHSWLTDTCLSLENGTKVEALLPQDCYVVMDASSQSTGAFLAAAPGQLWWDVCSGAGGKALLLKDKEPTIKITATDVRESVLHNLKARFKSYGLPVPDTRVVDVEDSMALGRVMGKKMFDNIICDVPCTGSGTWSRTPEQLHFFKSNTLAAVAQKQTLIAVNAARYLKPGGRLYYITCSVFASENEMVLDRIAENTGLNLLEMQLINGTGLRADSMFIGILEKIVR